MGWLNLMTLLEVGARRRVAASYSSHPPRPSVQRSCILDTEHGDSPHRERFSGCGNAQEIALLCSGNCHPVHDFVTFRDLIVDLHLHIWESRNPAGYFYFNPFAAGRDIRSWRIVIDKILGDHLIDQRRIAARVFLEKRRTMAWFSFDIDYFSCSELGAIQTNQVRFA
jgi:hypothetical protein